MKNSKLTFVQIAPPQDYQSGDYYYRLEMPARELAKLPQVKCFLNITTLSSQKIQLMLNADVLIINHVCDPDLLPVIFTRKEKGLLTIFEVGDNINDIQPWNPTYQFWKREENRTLFYYLLHVADAVQANNENLLTEFRNYNHRQVCFPNQMATYCSPEEKETGPYFVVGWGGSYGHKADIQSIAPVLIHWVKSHDNVKLAIMASEDIFQFFDPVGDDKKLYFPPGSIEDYYQFLRILDVGVAPLLPTDYNRCRSDVKFIEYAAFRVVPVLQDFGAYSSPAIPGGTRYLFKEADELSGILSRLYEYPELRKHIIEKAYAYILKERLIERKVTDRIEFYLKLFQEKGARKGDQRLFENFQGYVPYTPGEFEDLLFEGLVNLGDEKSREQAKELFLKARSLRPDNYLPDLFLSQCSTPASEHLLQSLEKFDYSIKARELLAEEYIREGAYSEALKVYRDILKILPDYPVVYRKSADVLRAVGLEEKAHFMEQEAKAKMEALQGKKAQEVEEKTKRQIQKQPGLPQAELYLIMPRGKNFGWGICGKYLAKELSEISRISYITQPFEVSDVGDELDYHTLTRSYFSLQDFHRILKGLGEGKLDVPVLQAIEGINMRPWGVEVRGKRVIGYTFFEDNLLPPISLENARRYFDLIITGSKWCEEVLREYKITHVKTIIQGIDPMLFNPANNEKQYFKNRFVIFSGGKFELRKGQDLVIRAFKHLQQKYDDVLLINSWYNIWEASLLTMQKSKYIKFEKPQSDYFSFINHVLTENGVDLKDVITLPPKDNQLMARIYKNTDLGLFPNRCEGGTNLVLMEYMACGKPVLAAYNSGHRDILTDKNALLIKKMGKMEVFQGGRLQAVWDDPDLDELIASLEWAHDHSEDLLRIGEQAGKDLSRLTWRKTAEEFLKVVKGEI